MELKERFEEVLKLVNLNPDEPFTLDILNTTIYRFCPYSGLEVLHKGNWVSEENCIFEAIFTYVMLHPDKVSKPAFADMILDGETFYTVVIDSEWDSVTEKFTPKWNVRCRGYSAQSIDSLMARKLGYMWRTEKEAFENLDRVKKELEDKYVR